MMVTEINGLLTEALLSEAEKNPVIECRNSWKKVTEIALPNFETGVGIISTPQNENVPYGKILYRISNAKLLEELRTNFSSSNNDLTYEKFEGLLHAIAKAILNLPVKRNVIHVMGKGFSELIMDMWKCMTYTGLHMSYSGVFDVIAVPIDTDKPDKEKTYINIHLLNGAQRLCVVADKLIHYMEATIQENMELVNKVNERTRWIVHSDILPMKFDISINLSQNETLTIRNRLLNPCSGLKRMIDIYYEKYDPPVSMIFQAIFPEIWKDGHKA